MLQLELTRWDWQNKREDERAELSAWHVTRRAKAMNLLTESAGHKTVLQSRLRKTNTAM